jgi:hypothetical protein
LASTSLSRETERMSRKRDPELVSPGQMAEMMTVLYPVRRKKGAFTGFRFDFVRYADGPFGFCVYPRKSPKGLKRTLGDYAKLAERPYPQVLREIYDRKVALLVVDPFAYEDGGWSSFLLVALHEYAHFLRHVIGEIYQWEFRVRTFEQTLGLLQEFNNRVYGKRGYKKIGPLFGDWCVWDGDFDPYSHDPLFFFILYFLERKAQERGYFGMDARPEGSVVL